MRGFSYVELLVGFVISTFLVLGFVRYSHQMTHQFLAGRRHQQAHGQLLTAQTSLRRIIARGEPAFWNRYPLVRQIIHKADTTVDHLQATQLCPHAERGGCLTSWDLVPLETAPIFYKLVAHDFPNWIHPTPVEDHLPAGPGDRFQPGTVLILANGDEIFPVVIAEVAGDEVALVSRENHPWSLPEKLPAEGSMTLAPIARLESLHVSLSPSQGRSFTLRYQPWAFQSDHWQPQRSRTGETHFIDLAIQPGDEIHPHRLVLVTQPAMPSPLPKPRIIAGKSYQEEVYHANIAF